MLEKVEIKGYKSVFDVTLELGRLTVLVGANGSGKTSILEAIGLANEGLLHQENPSLALTEPGLGLDEYELEELVCWEAEATRIDLFAKPRESAARLWGRLELLPKNELKVTWGDDGAHSESEPWGQVARYLRLSPALIAAPSHSHEETPRFKSDGENAGSVLDAMPRAVADRLAGQLAKVVPGVSGIRAGRKKVRSNGAIGHEPVFTIHGHDVRACHASEGTNLVLGILLGLTAKTGPTTVLLDDLQRGLHPRAQVDVVNAIRGLLDADDELQVVATTHSPYLVDELDPTEVVVVAARDGRTYAKPLSEHPDSERWLGELRTGEFWSSVGEDWVVGS